MTTNPPTTITYSLEEVLTRFEQNMNRQFAEVNQKMDKQFAEVNHKFDEVNQKFDEVNQKMDKQFAEVNQKLVKLEIGQTELSGEIKTLDAKVDGISKRLDNQEFINRGVLVALIVALIGGAAKLLGWMPTK